MEAEQVAVNPFLSTFSAALPAGTNRQLFLSCYQQCLKVEISLINCGFLDNLQTLKNVAYHMRSESQVPREGLKRKFSVHTDFYFLLLTPPRWLQGRKDRKGRAEGRMRQKEEGGETAREQAC